MAGLDGTDTSTTIYIDDLNPLNPDKDDPKSQGDDHLRFIKRVLKNTFPNITGPVTATETELNYIDGVTSAIQTQLSNLIPSGTAMLFVQAAAPTGWTRVNTHNDKALRIVNTTGGGSGGSVAFSTVFGKTDTDGYTLTSTDIPAHTHAAGTLSADLLGAHTHSVVASAGSLVMSGAGGASAFTTGTGASNQSATAQSNGAHTHTISGASASTGGDGSHKHGLDIRVNYVDALICTKNA